MERFTATFRFYEELNDFLPKARRKIAFSHSFKGGPSIKHVIESLHVPHTEVDLIIVNRVSKGFDYALKDGDHVSVYPVFESFDISPIVKLRAEPLRKTAFILDVHLGKLVRLLRMMGFDCLYDPTLDDDEIIDLALSQHRIILTRDRLLLHRKRITHGYCIRSQRSINQAAEILIRFQLRGRVNPFTRCLSCNGILNRVDKEQIVSMLEPKTRLYFNRFAQCVNCRKIYWKGSHADGMNARLMDILKNTKRRNRS